MGRNPDFKNKFRVTGTEFRESDCSFRKCSVDSINYQTLYLVGSLPLTRQAVALPTTFHPVGGHKVAPLLSQLLQELETPNLADGWVGPHKDTLWCKFGVTGSIFRWSNDVKNRKFTQFSANHAELQLNASVTQTITDRIDLQKREDAQ